MSEVKAANGAAVQANGDVTVSYGISGTKIAGISGKTTTPTIYIPITNPASTSYKIDNVKVDFDGGAASGKSTGVVTDMWVYFGNTQVYHAGLNWSNTTTFTATIPADFKVADASSYGVLVALALSLPNNDGSNITLYSVDATFKA